MEQPEFPNVPIQLHLCPWASRFSEGDRLLDKNYQIMMVSHNKALYKVLSLDKGKGVIFDSDLKVLSIFSHYVIIL